MGGVRVLMLLFQIENTVTTEQHGVVFLLFYYLDRMLLLDRSSNVSFYA